MIGMTPPENIKCSIEEAPYDDIAKEFKVKHVMTCIGAAHTVDIDDNLSMACKSLDAKGFSYAPVREDVRIVGIISSEDCRISDSQTVRESMIPLGIDNTVDANSPIESLVHWLSVFPFQMVLENKQAVGLVHASDLNKQVVRSLIHLHLVDLENKMTKVVRANYSDSDEWISLLEQERQKLIMRTKRKMAKGMMDVDLLEFVYFTDLLKIIKNTDIIKRIPEATNSKWVKELRNCVAHPVKPLLNTVGGVQAFAANIESLHLLINAFGAMLEQTNVKECLLV